jgi:uncharacterized membrane protein
MIELSPTRTSGGRNRRRGVSPPRLAGLVGGSALAIYGITRRSPLGLVFTVSGGAIAALGAVQKRSRRQHSVWSTILVNCSREDAYRFWRDFENLPRFMNRLETVTILNRGRSQWTAIGPMGRRIRWYAEITNDRENESIAWNSLPNSDVEVNGEVRFVQAPPDRGTLIRARIDYSPSLGTSSALAKFLNKGVNFLMRQDLRRLEAIMEAGEIPTIEGQSHGPRDVVTGAMRVADPTRPVRRGSDLREVFAMRRSVA